MNRFFSIARHKGGLFIMMACLLCLGSTVPGISTGASTETLPFKVEKTDHGVTFRNRQTGKALTHCAASLQKHHDLFIFGQWCRGSADDTLTYGAINADDGRLILKPVYDRIETRYKDRALIVERDGLWGVMTWDGRKRLPIRYDDISASSSDPGTPWKISKNKKYGIYDPSGNKIVVPLKFDWILLRQGYVLAVKKSGKHGFDKKWHAYNYAGQPIPHVGDASHLAVWRDNGWLVIDRNHAVDHKGNVVIPKGRFDVVSPVGKHAIVGAKGRYGLIDRHGKIQLPLEYKRLVQFPHRDDWFRFTAQDGEHYGVVNASGAQILAPEWDGISLRRVSDPKAGENKEYFLVKRGHKRGSLTLQGKTLISPIQLLTKFIRERPLYAVRDKRGVGICNLASGKCPVEPQYDAIRLLDDSRVGAPLFVVEKDNLDGLINRQGHVFLKPEYKHIIKIQSGLSQKGLRILAGRDEPQGMVLEFDDAKRQWRVARENIDMQKLLAAPYDGHGVAELEHPSIKARYLPARYKDATRVVKGYLDGELRELSYPSLQLTSNTAYIFFGSFTSERRRLANTLPACQQSDGYAIVLDAPAQPSSDACNQADHSTDVLHFRYTDDGHSLSCAECAKLGVPTRWVESPVASRQNHHARQE